MSLVGVNSIRLGPKVLGPGGVRLGLGFPCFYPEVCWLLGLGSPIGVMDIPGWG